MTQYIVLCGQVVGFGPFEFVYDFDGGRFADRKKAIRHGFKVRGSDDFNIGVVVRGKIVSLDWMWQPVDTNPAFLDSIAEEICL